MAIDPNLVSIIPASELPTGVPTSIDEFLFYDGYEMKKSPMTEIYELVSGSQSIGTITPSSTIPAEGNIWGFAGEGTYPNAGNITVSPNTIGILTRVGTTWSKVEVDADQNITQNVTNITYPAVDPSQIVPSEALYTDETLAGDILKRVDKTTGENVNYRETTDINEVDGVVYVQKSNKKYKLQNSGVYNLALFGAKQDGVTDDTDAINRAMLFSAKNGGCAFEFNTNAVINVNGTILLPTHTKINLNGSTILANMQTVFSSAYLVNGSLTTNQNAIDEAVEAQLRNSGVYNGTIQNAKVGFYLKNFIIGCFLRDLTFNACEQSWFCHRCFYTVFENIISLNGINTPGIFAYHFNESNNAISLKRVTSTKEENFLFQGGTAAISIDCCTSEGGTKGFVFEDDCFGIDIKACYFEALKDVFDFSGVTNGNFNISGNYINMTDRVMIAPDFPAQLYGTFDETNTIVNVGTAYNGFTYRGLMDIGKPRNMMKYSYISNIENINTLPSNWLYGEQNNVEIISAKGITNSTFMGKTKNITGVIPVVRGGDVGPGYDGYILGSTHSQTETAGDFVVHIDTKINLRNNVFAKFHVIITTNSNMFTFFGDIYGSNVKQFDTTGKTITISDNNGFIRLNISSFSESYTGCKGSIQLLV